jgi:putative hemolysin
MAGLQLIRLLLPGREGIQELVNTVAMTFIVLLFGEILPKTVFRARADALALRSAPVLRISDSVLRPIVSLFTVVSQWAARFSGEEDREERTRIMREELRLLAEMGEEGEQKKSQVRMVNGILSLEGRSIARIMTPLVDIVAVSEDDTPDVFLQRVAESGFSRIPVYHDRIDNIVGLVHVLDVLLAGSPGESLKPFIRRDIRHEPESRRVFPLLQELTRSRSPMVFVVDEYGGVVGLVTVEDLVEEVMGDIWDEKDTQARAGVHRISDRVLDCEGKTEIQVLNHDFELGLPEGDYVTIAGFVTERLQRIPRPGESLTLGKLKILVLDADAKCVKRVRIISKGV